MATKADIAEVRADMEKMELRLKIWVGWGFFIAVGVIGGIIAYATSLLLSAVAG